MRNKRAKAYRKMVGDVSAEYETTEYQNSKTHLNNFGIASNPDWHKVTNTIKLTEDCGRSAYKFLKEIDN